LKSYKVVSGSGFVHAGAKLSYVVLCVFLTLALSAVSATAQEIRLTPRGAPSLESMKPSYGILRMAPAPPAQLVPPDRPVPPGLAAEKAEEPEIPPIIICPVPSEDPGPIVKHRAKLGFSNSFKEPKDSTVGSAGYTVTWIKNEFWEDQGHELFGSFDFISLDFGQFLREAARGTLDDAISIKAGGGGKALLSPGLWMGAGLYVGSTRSDKEWSVSVSLRGQAIMDISSLEQLRFGIAYSGDVFDISNVLTLVEDQTKTLGVSPTYSTTHYAQARKFRVDLTIGGEGTANGEKEWSYNGDATLTTSLGTGEIEVGYTCTHQQDTGIFHTVGVSYGIELPDIFDIQAIVP
jgi:hypothetical protein